MAQDKRETALNEAKEILKRAFERVAYKERKALFYELEAWANKELLGEPHDIFLEALYSDEISFDIRVVEAVKKAVDEHFKGSK